jgi:hypothetical protein
LFYLVTTAVRAGSLFGIMLSDGKNLRECFLASVTEELIVGHIDLPRSLKASGRILDLLLESVQGEAIPNRRR